MAGSGTGTRIVTYGLEEEVLTWAEARAHIRDILEEREPEEGVWSNSSLMAHANMAIRNIVAKMNYKAVKSNISVASGAAEYPRPSRDQEIIALYIDGTPLKREYYEDRNMLTADELEDTGTPQYYLLTQDSVEFRPTPNAAFTANYVSNIRPAPIDSTDDEVGIDPRLYDAFFEYVLAKAYEQVGRYDTARVRWENFLRYIEDHTDQQVDEIAADTYFTPREVW